MHVREANEGTGERTVREAGERETDRDKEEVCKGWKRSNG